MVGGLFAGADPWGLVPPRYRPGAAAPAAMSPELRAVRQEAGLMALEAFFMGGADDDGREQ